MDLDHVRSEIEHMRLQVGRQRKEILQLQRAGIGRALLVRMLARAAAGHVRGLLLPTRPGDHHCGREGAGQPRLLSQRALRRRLARAQFCQESHSA